MLVLEKRDHSRWLGLLIAVKLTCTVIGQTRPRESAKKPAAQTEAAKASGQTAPAGSPDPLILPEPQIADEAMLRDSQSRWTRTYDQMKAKKPPSESKKSLESELRVGRRIEEGVLIPRGKDLTTMKNWTLECVDKSLARSADDIVTKTLILAERRLTMSSSFRSLCSVALGVAFTFTTLNYAQQEKPAGQQEKPATKQEITVPGAGTMQVTTIKATVEAVDQQNRTVTLKGPRGNVFTVPVSERVKNLPQVKAGDVVNIAYFEAVAVEAKKSDAPLSGSETYEEDSAPPGEKPAGVVLRKVRAITEVLEVNSESQSVRVRGPRGNVAEVKVRDPQVVSSLKAGDKVDLTYIEGVAIEVNEAAAAE